MCDYICVGEINLFENNVVLIHIYVILSSFLSLTYLVIFLKKSPLLSVVLFYSVPKPLKKEQKCEGAN